MFKDTNFFRAKVRVYAKIKVLRNGHFIIVYEEKEGHFIVMSKKKKFKTCLDGKTNLTV